MKDMTARLAEQLKNDPAALRTLMQSPDGQALIRMLTQGDRGAGLQQAAQSAARGDTTQLTAMVRRLMGSPQGAALVERINQAMQKYGGAGPAMAEFDDKLNSILSNPDAMAQIMQLAQSIGGGDGPPAQTPPAQQTPPAARSGDLFSSLAGGLDPKLLLRLMPLIQELGGQRDSNAKQLLYALRPYLKPERQEKVERALQLARLFHLGKKFLSEWEGWRDV